MAEYLKVIAQVSRVYDRLSIPKSLFLFSKCAADWVVCCKRGNTWKDTLNIDEDGTQATAMEVIVSRTVSQKVVSVHL